MKHVKIVGIIMAAILLCTSMKLECLAYVQDNYEPLEELPQGADVKDYITLIPDFVEYQVKEGDTLWGIAKQLLGSGSKYHEIFQKNRDIIADANRIFPGQVLNISSQLYIPKDKYDRGGLVSEGAVHIALPDLVANSMFLHGDIEDHTSFRSGITIYSLPCTNHMGENALTADWDNFSAEVIRCSESCEGRVSGLTFEKYQMEDGCDLCGYYFDFDTGEKTIEFAAFYRLGKKNMAEVIGLRKKEADTKLVDVTRYIAASFEDFGGRVGMGYDKTTDNIGAWDWDYPELHNVFTAAMTNFVQGTKRPEKNMPGDYEVVWKEPAFEEAVRKILISLWELDEEEEKEFLSRPLMASDISVISNVQCTYYKEGSPYAEEGSIASMKPVVSLICDGCREEFSIRDNVSFSYQDLSNFKGARQLRIGVNDLTDYSFISDMPQLRFLSIVAGEGVEDISFLSNLKQLRTLMLMGFCYEDSEGKPGAFGSVTDLSVLGNCPELAYLYLQMPQLTDFSFLENCPEICTIKLFGDESYQGTEGRTPACPDLELLPNARFIEFYGESVRWEP